EGQGRAEKSRRRKKGARQAQKPRQERERSAPQGVLGRVQSIAQANRAVRIQSEERGRQKGQGTNRFRQIAPLRAASEGTSGGGRVTRAVAAAQLPAPILLSGTIRTFCAARRDIRIQTLTAFLESRPASRASRIYRTRVCQSRALRRQL